MNFFVSLLRPDKLRPFGTLLKTVRTFKLTRPNHSGTNKRRPKLASASSSNDDKRKALRDSAHQMAASANRKHWEENNANLASRVGKISTSEIFYAPDFEQRYLQLDEAVENIRESAQPEMYDCLENPLRVKFTLNMRTTKKTKFIQKFEGHFILPHLLDFLPKGRVVALCKDSDEAALALEKGATLAGAEELFSDLEHGKFHREEFDYVVAHERWEPTMGKLRSVLKDRLPTTKNGRLGQDPVSLVATFCDGVSVSSIPLDGVPEICFLDVIIGQPCWELDLLRDNLQSYFNFVETNKSSRIVGTGVLAADLFCPPTGEHFPLDCTPFVTISEQLKSRSKTRPIADESAAADEGDDERLSSTSTDSSVC